MNYDDLRTLDELRRTGAITEEEYQREKEKFFNQTENSQTSNSKPFFGMKENSYIALMHISQFTPGLTFVTPIILWLINRSNSTKVDSVGKHIINFIISMLIYYVASGILCIVLIGIPMLITLGIMQIVFVIIATVKTYRGEEWRYPLTIEFLK